MVEKDLNHDLEHPGALPETPLTKMDLLVVLQERWNQTNGVGLMSDEDEFAVRKEVAAIEDFLVDMGILTRDDLQPLQTWGWRRQGSLDYSCSCQSFLQAV